MITGIAGFAGSHLADRMIEEGIEVLGTILPGEKLDNIQHLGSKITLLPCDVRDLESILDVMEQAHPNLVFHLAAQASVGLSYHDPGLTLDVNVKGTANLLEASRRHANELEAIIVVSSAEVYGVLTPEQVPVSEDTPFAPVHTYAISKVATHFLAQVYHKTHDLPVIEARPFNHIGPRQGRGFVVPDFASQIAEYSLGLSDKAMRVGNLQVIRDFTDVRDVARAYLAIARRGKPGSVYHICSGEAVTVSNVLDKLVALSGKQLQIESDPALWRPAKMPVLIGDASKLKHDTGWETTIALDQSLRDTLDYWIDHLSTTSKQVN
ncbi:MAG: GDP-mannose 4,6-dehydratase [Chloroflexota bacterium]